MAPSTLAYLPGSGTRETRTLSFDPGGELATEFFTDLAAGAADLAAGADLTSGADLLAGLALLARDGAGRLLEVAFAVRGPTRPAGPGLRTADERTYRLAGAALATFDARVREGSAPDLALLRVLRNGGGVTREDARLRTRAGGLAYDLASGALVPVPRGEARERTSLADGACQLSVSLFGNMPGHHFAAACTMTLAIAPQAGPATAWKLAFAVPAHLAPLLPELVDLATLGLTHEAALAGAAAGGGALTWQALGERLREVPLGLRGLPDMLIWLEDQPPRFERAQHELESLAFARP